MEPISCKLPHKKMLIKLKLFLAPLTTMPLLKPLFIQPYIVSSCNYKSLPPGYTAFSSSAALTIEALRIISFLRCTAAMPKEVLKIWWLCHGWGALMRFRSLFVSKTASTRTVHHHQAPEHARHRWMVRSGATPRESALLGCIRLARKINFSPTKVF